MDACSAAKLLVCMVCMEAVWCELPSQQVSAMSAIYQIIGKNTSGATSFVWSSFSKHSNPCLWKGVGCSPDHSSIININFSRFGISTAEFLPFLCNITTLESLDVSNIGMRSFLYGFLSGCGNITGLKHMDFSWNQLYGPLPSFNGFKKLERLYLGSNWFSGEIGLQFQGLISLRTLDLSGNWLSGRVPTNLGNMTLLEELMVNQNSFTGSIPREWSKLARLKWLSLSFNDFNGSIPAWLSNITTLKNFEGNYNGFSGMIPSGIASHLTSLSLSGNMLAGEMLSDMLSGPYLEIVDLSDNELEGAIPVVNSTALHSLDLGSNNLNGTVPWESFGNLMSLVLSENRLKGSLPTVLGNCTSLGALLLDFNDFVGEIPLEISQLNLLRLITISGNLLNGSIPIAIGNLSNLMVLDMGNNQLSGPMPASIRNLFSLEELQLGNNQLSGPISYMPESLLNALNLSNNLFAGLIPDTLSNLRQLRVLDLSNNRFSGQIPDFLTRLSCLTQLLLTNNNLSGVVPMFRNGAEVDTRGNGAIENPSSHRKKKSVHTDFGIAAASGVPVGLLIWIIIVFISRRYKTIHGYLSPPNTIHTPIVNFKKAMKAVSDLSNIVLKSRFSTFYKAVMPSGTTYLVKKFNHNYKKFTFPRYKELVEELEVLGELSNQNVMIPVAYIMTARTTYLVYNFVRGTLHDILHHRNGTRFDWASRFAIAVGVSKGLSFLHECSSGSIVLLDLCSKSILLKSLEEPLISDIELCNLIHPSKSRRGGSVGYVPPEYGSTKKVTAAGNVYSFGVVLLELVTGKPAVSEGTELAKWVLSIGNKWDEILDSSISETSVAVRNQMEAVLEVALSCISKSPEMRPNSGTVEQMLLSRRSNN